MQFGSLLESFVIMMVLVACAVFLRQHSVITKSEQGVFARLVTDFALPALILANLSREPIELKDLELALVLFAAIALVMTIAWLVGRWMRLERPVLGSVILVSGVGCTSTLGYSLIHNIYGDNTDIMSQLVIMGEFGVVLPLFVFGVAIAKYFGEDDGHQQGFGSAIKGFVRSPIFLALLLGLLLSNVGLRQDHWAVELMYRILQVASDSLTFLVAFTIGLMLRPIMDRQIAKLILLVGSLKLILEPLVAVAFAWTLQIPDLQRDLLVVEAAMPSGALATVIAARYGCDAAVASALLVATLILSLLAIPLIGFLAL